jgi:hypothetical protein
MARGKRLYLSHYESFDQNGYYWARYYLDRVDLDDLDNPARLPKVNVPGQFVGATPDNQVIYTVENWWTTNDTRTYLHTLDLATTSDRAYLRDTLSFDGYLDNSLVFHGGYAYTTLDRYDSNSGNSSSVLLTVDLSNPDALSKTEAVLPGQGWVWWQGVKVAGQRAFLSSGDGVAIFDISQPEQPRFQSYERTYGYSWYGSDALQVQGNVAYVPTGSSGVQMIQLDD